MKDLLLALLITIPLFLEGPLLNSGVSRKQAEMAMKLETLPPFIDSLHKLQTSAERSLQDSVGINSLPFKAVLDL